MGRQTIGIAVGAALAASFLVRPVSAADEAAPLPVMFFLSEAEAGPGETVNLVLSIRTEFAIRHLSFALNFDEGMLQALDVQRLSLAADAGPILDPAQGVSSSTINNNNEIPGNQLSEGWITVQFTAPASGGLLNMPLGTLVPLLGLTFKVKEDAQEGLSPVEFTTVVSRAPDGPAVYYVNWAEVVDDDEGHPAPPAPAALQNGGVRVKIVGETGFMRADSNQDRQVDVSDPLVTLGHLYDGAASIRCTDAADANDDGRLDIADPIYTLAVLFQGAAGFPEPTVWGLDPTPDSLSCPAY